MNKNGNAIQQSPFSASAYGTGIRAQVFQLILRQAVNGVDWKKECTKAMTANSISVEEIEAELSRRQKLSCTHKDTFATISSRDELYFIVQAQMQRALLRQIDQHLDWPCQPKNPFCQCATCLTAELLEISIDTK